MFFLLIGEGSIRFVVLRWGLPALSFLSCFFSRIYCLRDEATLCGLKTTHFRQVLATNTAGYKTAPRTVYQWFASSHRRSDRKYPHFIGEFTHLRCIRFREIVSKKISRAHPRKICPLSKICWTWHWDTAVVCWVETGLNRRVDRMLRASHVAGFERRRGDILEVMGKKGPIALYS